MRAFLIWAGDESRDVARELRELIVNVHRVRCFFSEEIEPGAEWRDVIGKNLEEANFAIVCLSRESLGSRWLHFEAGAVAKLAGASVVPYLIGDIEQRELKGPLSAYQALRADRDGTLRLLRKMNGQRPKSRQIQDKELTRRFDSSFGKLEALLSRESADPPPSVLERITRLEREVAALRSKEEP